MVWVTLILALLRALPSLISVIEEIWGVVHSHPFKVHAFEALLLKHQDNPAGAEADFRSFHAVHVLGHPEP